MEKAPDAFRTISEVSEWLGTPAHVLRFWESRFPQVRPVKRAGGRRYYRPSDVALLGGIKKLLHDDGLTIRGVQKMLREQGIRYVAGLAELTSPEPSEEPPTAGPAAPPAAASPAEADRPRAESEPKSPAPAAGPDGRQRSVPAFLESVRPRLVPGQDPREPAAAARQSELFATDPEAPHSAPNAEAAPPAPATPLTASDLVDRIRNLEPGSAQAALPRLVDIYERLQRLRDRMAAASDIAPTPRG